MKKTTNKMTKFRRKRKTTKKEFKKADAILAADIHLRPDIPVCRTDNYFGAMSNKTDCILELSEKHDCVILMAGDIGQWPEKAWPTWLLEWVINKFLNHKIICIPGQHDLPNHKLDLWQKSGIGVLQAAGAIQILGINNTYCILFDKFLLRGYPYGEPLGFECPFYIDENVLNKQRKIAMTHQTVLSGKSMFDGIQGLELLREFPEYDLILSGDNHLPFVIEYQGRILVNPGSMMRNTADQIDHKPRVYLWYADENRVEPVYLPIEQGVISREHISNVEEKKNRFDAMIKRIEEDVEIELSFEDNMTKYFKKYRTEKAVKEKTLIHVQ